MSPLDRLRCQQGLTIIEALIAAFVVVIGIIGLIGAFDAARKLTLTSERRTTIAHRAQQELERLQAVPYAQLAMYETPAHSSEPENPDFYIASGAPPSYQYGAGVAESEPVVLATAGKCGSPAVEGCGSIGAAPTAWAAGNLSGKVYDFVSWHTDSGCKPGCWEPTKAYKRVTVVVTVSVPAGSHPVKPIRYSTLVANPAAAPGRAVSNGKENPLTSPETTCGSPPEPCTSGIDSGNAQSWFLHDSPAISGKATAPAADHPTHPTIAPTDTTCSASSTSAACPMPDVMESTTPSATTLFNYSTDLGVTPVEYAGGRVLNNEAACGATPQNSGGEMWVTEPLAAKTKLTGSGGLSLFTQTIGGLAQEVTLCVALYDVPENIENLVKTPPTPIGEASYTPDAWPQTMSELAFIFKVPSATLAEGHRIGVRIWPAAASTGKVAIAYDAASTPATLQLNTE